MLLTCDCVFVEVCVVERDEVANEEGEKKLEGEKNLTLSLLIIWFALQDSTTNRPD